MKSFKMRKSFDTFAMTTKHKEDGFTVYKGGASPAMRRDD